MAHKATILDEKIPGADQFKDAQWDLALICPGGGVDYNSDVLFAKDIRPFGRPVRLIRDFPCSPLQTCYLRCLFSLKLALFKDNGWAV
jgi:hypothetical protein